MTSQEDRSPLSRRSLLKGATATSLLTGATFFLAGCGGGSAGTSGGSEHPDADDYLNFLLNVEYIEAEYYSLAVTGTGLSVTLSGGASAGPVVGGGKVPFQSSLLAAFSSSTAQQHLNHVNYLRSSLGASAVERPGINFSQGFQVVGAGSGLGESFSPFVSETGFLLGAFFLEELAVSAYRGAINQSSSIIGGILGDESYHGGILRTLIYQAGGAILTSANGIVAYRNELGGGGDAKISSGSILTLCPSTATGTAISRSSSQVLDILYNSATGVKGSFLPLRANGIIN